MTSHIETLVQQLDGKADESYDARAELICIGSDATPAIIDGLPSLGGFGQLTAIEVFEEVTDPRCGPALIALLHSDNPTVREWAAMALASRRSTARSSPCAVPIAPAWNGRRHRTGASRKASTGPDRTRRPHPRRPTACCSPTSHRCGQRPDLDRPYRPAPAAGSTSAAAS
ncbi:hypothetical protein GCM10010222_04790 [Streptomyces tanashiensis]|nr:hypothetical protein GCM10010222_04790 [Streptomyces tanashiensis]